MRNIKTSLNRFLSITGIVAIGTSFLAGLTAAAPDMRLNANFYYGEQSIYDINIKGTLGLTEEDLEIICRDPQVDFAMPAYVVDKVVLLESGEGYTARIYGTDLSLYGTDGYLNEVMLISGRMPQSPNECVLIVPGDAYAYQNEFEIGTELFVSNNGEVTEEVEEEAIEIKDEDDTFDFDDTSLELPETESTEILQQQQFTVVGIARSSMYYSLDEMEPSRVGSGSIRLALYVQQECFDSEVYTDIYVKLVSEENETNYFSDLYIDNVDSIVDILTPIGVERALLRYEEVRIEIYDRLAEAQQTLDDARIEVEEELADARREIADAEIELRDGQEELNEKMNEYTEGLNQYIDACAQLEAAKTQLALMEPYVTMLKQLQAGGATLTPTELAQIAQYDMGMQQISATETTLWSVAQQLISAKELLDDAQEEINEGHEDLHQAQIDLAEAEQKIEEKLTDAQTQIDDAYKEIDDMDEAEWYFFTLEDNISYSSYSGSSSDIEAVARAFPIFFFLVAMLVSLTTMTRMVEEQRTQIGILKSLGYTDGNIKAYYLIYGGIASCVGCIIGIAPGFIIFPKIIMGAYAMMYALPTSFAPFHLLIASVVAGSIVLAIAGTSYIVCKDALKHTPAALLVPPAPPAGKRIFLENISFIWKRLSFTQKVTARNLFRYKKRLIMTVIGVCGCTALLVTGYGIKNSLSAVVDKQFGEINTYDFMVAYSEDRAFETDEIAASLLTDERHVQTYLPIFSSDVTVGSAVFEKEATLLMPENFEIFADTVNLRNRKTGEKIELSENSVVVTEKAAEQMQISIGDSITIETDDKTVSVTVTGIAENYVYDYVYIGSAIYERIFDEPPKFYMIYIHINPETTYTDEELSAEFLEGEKAVYVMSVNTLRNSFSQMLTVMDSIVYVLIVFSGALALIVLYNLTNINIGEREKELGTLKVLGFNNKEVSSYIFKEVYMLSLLGSIIGLGLGKILHTFIITTIEVSMVMFGREVFISSYAIAIVITMLFTFAVSIVMQKRLRSIDMVEAMKAGE